MSPKRSEKPDWESPDMKNVYMVEQGDNIYYNPEVLKNDPFVGIVRRFLNKHFGISPYHEFVVGDEFDDF